MKYVFQYCIVNDKYIFYNGCMIGLGNRTKHFRQQLVVYNHV